MSFIDRRFVRSGLGASLAVTCLTLVGCGGGSTSIVVGRSSGDTDDGGGEVIVLSPGDDAGADGGTSTWDDAADGRHASAADAAITCPSDSLACNGKCVPNDVYHCGACDAPCAAPDSGSVACAAAAGSYACISCGMATLCGSTCTDPTTDANNCGTCGHSCIGGACVNSQCQAWTVANTTPYVLLQDGPAGTHSDLVTDGKNVVWIDIRLGILQAPVTGDPSAPPLNLSPRSPLSGNMYYHDLAIANGVVAWTLTDDTDGIALWSAREGVANSGAQVASVGPSTTADTPRGLALDAKGATAYFLTDAPIHQPSLYQCSLANRSCSAVYRTTSSASTPTPNEVVMAGSQVCWTDSTTGFINRFDPSSNNVVAVAGQQGTVFALAADSTYLYWATSALVTGGNSGFAVMRTTPTNPGFFDVVQPITAGSLVAMATDETNLYFSEIDSSYRLEYVPLNGTGQSHALQDGQVAYAVATGGGAVYWLSGLNTIQGIRAP